jgi:hypothetical protein
MAMGVKGCSKQSSHYYLLDVGTLVILFFDPECGGNIFLRNVCTTSKCCMLFMPEGRTLVGETSNITVQA